MNKLIIGNGTVVTLGEASRVIDGGAVYIEDDVIQGVGTTKELKKKNPKAKFIDAKGKVVMPGYICAHHHFYSTMARGFCPPGEPATNFVEILERMWWKIDKALDKDDVALSALIPLVECIRNGTTTILDHHASPSCREGSLDTIAKAVREAGLRASLCYEVSDRNQPGAGIEENERFIRACAKMKCDQLHAMMGLHASFTVGDDTLARCRTIMDKYNAGAHVHVAEDAADEAHCQKTHGMSVVKRFHKFGITGDQSLFIHCIHIDDEEMEILVKTGTIAIHNPESNMNNAVGAARVLEMMKKGVLVGLGTDGMASDMPSQMRCGYLLHRHNLRDPRVAFVEMPTLLLWNNARIASRLFGTRLGELSVGAKADVILVDYEPPTPLTSANFLGHFIFGMVDAVVDTTICNGRVLMRNKEVLSLDEDKIAAKSRKLAPKMWARIR